MKEAEQVLGKPPKLKRIEVLCLLGMLAFLLFLWLMPVVNTLLRYGTLAWLGLLWAYVLWLAWRSQAARYAWLGLTVVLGLLVGLARGPEVGAEALQQEYVRALQRYEGSPYVWGGENRLGIDCSGLVRAAMIDAEIRTGIQYLSPQALRRAFAIWFRDAGADTLAAGYHGRTRRVLEARDLNSLDHARLAPGDLMVDEHGVHTMIYLGDSTWIEADPTQMRVLKARVPSQIHWFKVPVTISRWTSLDAKG